MNRNNSNNWIQQRDNFFTIQARDLQADIFMVTNLAEEILAGNVASLDIFSDDPVFDLYNQTLMQMMTFHDRIFGVPAHTFPSGVFVNYTLARANDIKIPPVDWTTEQFIDFVSHHEPHQWYGSWMVPLGLFERGTLDFDYQLLWREENESFVRMDTPAMRQIQHLAMQMAGHTFITNHDQGRTSHEFFLQHVAIDWAAGDGGMWRAFSSGVLLAFPLPNAAFLQISPFGSPRHPSRPQMAEWDYLPRPSTEWIGNHIGTEMIPFAIRNYAMDDDDPALSPEEYTRLKIAWEFLRFFTTDIRAWQAMSAFEYGPYRLSALDSFPFVSGQLFYDKMDILLETESWQIFQNQSNFPGFHYVVQLWEQGQNFGLSRNAFPMTANREVDQAIVQTYIPLEWTLRLRGDTQVGVPITHPEWADRMNNDMLPEWDRRFNQRWQERFDELYTVIQRYYPMLIRPGEGR